MTQDTRTGNGAPANPGAEAGQNAKQEQWLDVGPDVLTSDILKAKNWQTDSRRVGDRTFQGNLHHGAEEELPFFRTGEADEELPSQQTTIGGTDGELLQPRSPEEIENAARRTGTSASSAAAAPFSGGGADPVDLSATYAAAVEPPPPGSDQYAPGERVVPGSGRGDGEERSLAESPEELPVEGIVSRQQDVDSGGRQEAEPDAPQGETATPVSQPVAGEQPAGEVDEQIPSRPAVISGSGASLSEDGVTSASGQLLISDNNPDEARFVAGGGNGVYGSFSLSADGRWVYTLNNGAANVQALREGETVSETFTVASVDGTSHSLVITVSGTNDGAIIRGTSTAAVGEDAVTVAGGALTVSDVDTGEAHFVAATHEGAFGSLNIAADGRWTYALDNEAEHVQALGAGAFVTDSIRVTSADGTAQQITITIAGSNDAATITGSATGLVAEDLQLSATGVLAVADADSGEARFQSATQSGTYGSFAIGEDGHWAYHLDNGAADVQSLREGETVSETFSVLSADGTAARQIRVTITGTNDLPTMAGDTRGATVEDEVLTTGGTLSIADVDAGESAFKAGTHTGSYGSLEIDGEGNWSYRLDPKNGTVQALSEGEQTEDVITVASLDGTEQRIRVTITGTNDLPEVGAVELSPLAEDSSRLITGAQLLAAGRDVDGSDVLTVTGLAVDERYGSLRDNGDGTWTFTPGHDLHADDIPFSFTVSDGHESVNGTATLDLLAVADAPTLTVEAASGREDTAIALNIHAALTDLDGSETLSAVTVSGVPKGATLSAGTDNGNGTWTLSQAQLEGLTITPPANSGADFTLGLAVTASDANGSTSTTTASLPVTVTAVADTPTLTAKSVSGNEDKAITLNITSALKDLDGSESLAVTISGVPTGATLSAGTNNGDGSWTLTSAQLGGLKITPPANSDADFQLQVTATASEGENGDQASTSATFNVTVAAVADTPSLTVKAASGDEDTPIGLSIAPALKDLDGSESLSITISGVPAGARLSAGTNAGGGSWTLTPEQLSGLTITPPADSDADFTLTVTAKSTEAENLKTASRSASLKVTVAAVTDAPELAVEAASGDEDATVSLHITSALTDQDGSETLAVVIGNVPTGAKLTAGTKNADGTWTLSPVQLNGLGIKLAPDSGDDFSLTVSAISTETSTGARAVTTTSLPVTVNAVADTPLLSVSSARGEEDSAIRLIITANLTDSDGSEQLGVVIGNVPAGATLSAGSDNGDGTWTLTPAQLSGLTITPPANSDADFTLSVTAIASEQENGSSAQRSYSLPVTVSPVADLLEMSLAAPASGSEDSRIALHIDAGLIDSDGSESLTLTLDGVPAGASLSAGTDNGDGSWTLTLDQLADLAITPPRDSDRDFTLTLSATTLEGASGDRRTTVLEVPVQVVGAADAATLTAGQAAGYEDRAIALNLSAALQDGDGSETLSVTVAGLPEGAVLSAGTRNADGSYTLTPGQLRGLTVTPPKDSDADFRLSITATTTEREGDSRQTTVEQLVTVRADADAPQLTVAAAGGEEDRAIDLQIASRLTDADGSETISITISDVPAGAVLSTGTRNLDGSYTVSVDQLHGLTITPPADSDADFTLTVTAVSRENENGDTASTVLALPVSVAAVADTPGLATSLSKGQEDRFIALKIDPSLSDSDGSETISLIIGNLPAGALLSAGTVNDDGSWTVAADEIEGLAMLPPADASGNFTLSVTAVATETGNGASVRSAPVDLQVQVVGAADTPELTVHGTTGDEDTAIALDISAALRDSDGSESLAVTIAGVPQGAVLSAGSDNGDGTWTLSHAELQGLKVTPPADSDADFVLTVTATATEGDGDRAAVSYQLPVIVNGVADAPQFAGIAGDLQGMELEPRAGDEDSSIALDLPLVGGDQDGSEKALAILVRGLPAGARLSAGSDNGDGSWTLSQAQLQGLKVTPPQDSAGDFTLAFEVTSSESGSGHTTVTSFSVPVEVAAVADGVVLRADSASGPAGQPIRLNIIHRDIDRDGSETASFVIGDVPEGATLSAGSDNGDGSWTLTAAEISGLTITPPAGSTADFRLTVTATSTETENQDSTSDSIELPVYIRTSTGGGGGTAASVITTLEDTAVAIDLAEYLPQLEDAVSGSITVSGVPAGALLSAGRDNGDGSWTLSTAEADGLTVTPAADSGANIHLEFSATLACPTGELRIPEDGSIVSDEAGKTVVKGEIVAEGASGSSVDTWSFHHSGGALTIDTLSESGASFIDIDGDGVKDHIDIMMRLYDSEGRHIAVSDDTELGTADGSTRDVAGHNQDAYLHFDTLPAGDYTLVVGSWDLSTAEAAAGYNDNADIGYNYDHSQDTGPYRITFGGDVEFLPVLTTVTAESELTVQVTDVADAPTIAVSTVVEGEVVVEGEIVAEGASGSSVDTWSFHHSGGALTIDTLSESGAAFIDIDGDGVKDHIDIMMRLYDSGGRHIAVSDDSELGIADGSTRDVAGHIQDSYLHFDTLPAGDYTLVVGSWDLSTAEAAAGHNDNTVIGNNYDHAKDTGPYRITFSGDVDFLPVLTSATAESEPTVQVTDVADAPTLAGSTVSAVEHVAAELGLSATLADGDGSEYLSITISGVPAGAVLSAGSDNGDGSWTLTAGQLQGLTITPPRYSAEDFTLTVTATSTEYENGSQARSSFELPVTVSGSADAPILVVKGGAGAEDSPITLHIDSALTDSDGSETLGITISGVPEGATLSAGIDNGDGSWSLTAGQLAGLAITPPAQSGNDFTLTVTATSTEADSGSTARTVRSLPVIVNAVADALQASAAAAAGVEDTAIALDIDITRLDNDGSETVGITADGLPDGAVLSAGSRNDDGSWNLTLEDLDGLTVTPPADSDADFTIRFTATTVERENGSTAVSEFSIPVAVAAVVDGLSVATGPVTGREDTAIALDITAAIGDRDGSEHTTVTIGGVPEGAVLSAGIDNGDGSWTLTTGQLHGLTITPAANTADDFTLTLTAISSETAGGSVTASYEIPVTVAAVADAPVLSGGSAAGDENAAIALDIRAALADSDGSESLSAVTVSGVPEGATLSAGYDNGDGSWTLTAGQLAGLTITPPAYSDGDFNLTVRVSAVEAEGDSATSAVIVPVTVRAVATSPELAAAAAGGDEDTDIALDIRAALVDSDGSESLSVTVGGVPAGARLSAGSDNGDGSWTLSGEQLAGLTIRPPRNSGDDFTLTITATATEAGGGSSTTTASLPVTVQAVADAPALRIDSAAGAEDRAIALNISASLTDGDGSESLAVTVSGVPEGASLSAGSDNGDGSWTLTAAQLSGLTITPPADSDADFKLTVTATSTEAEGAQRSTSYVLPVSVEAVADGVIFTSTAAGDEDTAIALNLSAVAADSDGSETMSSITISGLPGGAVLSAGTRNDDGSWNLTLEDLDGLTVTPPHDSGASFNLVVTASTTESASGASIVTTYALPVTVHAVADTPTLTASAASGSEDTAVALKIATGLSDTDGSESLSAITISGVPEGAVLSAGTNNGDGSWTVSGSQLSGLTLTPPADSDADFTLHLAVSSTDSSGSVSTATVDLPVTVNAVADAPTLSAAAADGREDTAVALDIRAALSDVDGSETLSAVTISGVPAGATLSAGTNNGNGTWTVSAAQLEGLTLTPPADSSDDFTLTLAVSSQEARGGSAAATAQLPVKLTGVADIPTLTASAASGDEDTAIALPIASHLTDGDGSESLAVTISGVPEGAVLSAGVDNGDGSWTLTAGQLDGLTVTPPENAHGEFQLTITASSTESDGDTAGITRTATVTVNPVNDAAAISGTSTGEVGEDGITSVSGTLNVSDVDSGEAVFTAATHAGSYGSLTIDAAGNWTYTLHNDSEAVQGLGQGETANDAVTVTSADGSAQVITVTLTGANDAAEISGTSTGEVGEDGVTSVSGTLNVSDADSGEAVFTAATHTGSYGSLTIDAAGNWTYTLDTNSEAVQGLGQGETASDAITVTSADGSAQVITVTLTGANDAAEISGTSTGEVGEDGITSVSGTLAVSDADSGEAVFTAATHTGSYGSLTIDAAGNWTYTLDTNSEAFQGLEQGETASDAVSVTSADGTARQISITITGQDRNDVLLAAAPDALEALAVSAADADAMLFAVPSIALDTEAAASGQEEEVLAGMAVADGGEGSGMEDPAGGFAPEDGDLPAATGALAGDAAGFSIGEIDLGSLPSAALEEEQVLHSDEEQDPPQGRNHSGETTESSAAAEAPAVEESAPAQEVAGDSGRASDWAEPPAETMEAASAAGEDQGSALSQEEEMADPSASDDLLAGIGQETPSAALDDEEEQPAGDQVELDQFVVSGGDSGSAASDGGDLEQFAVSDSEPATEEVPAMDSVDGGSQETADATAEDAGIGADDAAIPEVVQEPAAPQEETVAA